MPATCYHATLKIGNIIELKENQCPEPEMTFMHDQSISTRARYLLITLITLWLFTFPAKGVLFQLSLYLLPLSVLFLKSTRTLLREHSPQTLVPLALLLCLPVLASESLYVLSAHATFSKEPFSAFWRLALFPTALAMACIASGVSQKTLQYMLLCAAMLYAISGLFGLVADIPIDGRDWGKRAAGLVSNPNPFGLLMAAATLVSVHLLFGATRKSEQLITAFCACVFITASLASSSRNVVLALSTAAILLLFLHRKTLFRPRLADYLIPVSTIALTVLILTLLLPLEDLIGNLAHRFSQASKGNVRLEIWAHYLKQVAEHPLLGLPSQAITRFSWLGSDFGAHNIYLDTLLRSGIMGLTALLACILGVIKILVTSANPEKAIALPLLFLLCQFGLYSGSIYSNEMIQGILAIILTIAIFSLIDIRQEKNDPVECLT